MKKIETYIFDIDGTLINSFNEAIKTMNTTLAKFSLPLITST